MILSLTTLLMTTLTSMNESAQIVEDTSQLPLLNKDLADRQTAKLRLSNGLQILLISDEKADQSAAAVCVGAGSWNDPIEYPGMAHFCEHMLFMGTKKYPLENEFFSSISDYAGMTNAYTAPNRTVYMFAAQNQGFLDLLDRFAHFFIDPLFNPENIAREMHAVDQEFAKNIENDSWREYMVFKETGNPNHPNRLFSTGNSDTLGKIPQSALKKWHSENYGAERMHLVIYSALPLETLKQSATQIFDEVPRSLQAAIDHSQPLSSKEQQGHITYIKPIQNRQSVTLSWELPPALSIDPTKSADVLAYALRRGQEHSLYQILKKEELIDSMSVRVDDLGGPQHRFFQISLELTRKGIKEMNGAILRCFEAIAGLKQTGVPYYLFQEKNAMSQLNYQYQDRQNPFEFIMSLGDSLADEELSSYPRNLILATEYNPETIEQVASLLTPQTCMISLLAPPSVTHVSPNRKEKWMQTEYAIRPIPSQWITEWSAAKPNPHILTAGPNPFIPEHLEIVADPQLGNVPFSIANDEIGSAYYIRSAEFGGPEIVYHIHIRSPQINPTARSAVLSSLYIDHLTDEIYPLLAAARSAGLTCSFDIDRLSLHLQVSGYSEKAPLFLEEIAKQMPLHPPTPEQFAIYTARHEKGYLNGEKELAARQAKELLESILNKDKTTKKEKLQALKTISYSDFLTFHKQLFEKTYIEALFAGNLSLKDAESAWLDIVHALGRTPYPKEEQSQTEILQLPQHSGPFEMAQSTDVQGNATLLLIDEGCFTFPKRALQEIFSSVIKEAFFNELRSKQKTGYIATSDGWDLEGRLFQYFLVQSNSHQPTDLLYRFEQFIEEFNDSLAQNVPSERFETLKTSLITSLKTRFRNLQDKSSLWDRLSFELDGDFQFVEKRIEALSNLSYADFLEQAPSLISRENRKRLAILYEGKLNAPFAYQSIQLPQIEEIATYAPRDKEKNQLDEQAAVHLN